MNIVTKQPPVFVGILKWFSINYVKLCGGNHFEVESRISRKFELRYDYWKWREFGLCHWQSFILSARSLRSHVNSCNSRKEVNDLISSFKEALNENNKKHS